VAIVNETMARQFWGSDALGQRVVFGERSLEVVGIARDAKYRTLGEVTRPQIYLPLRQAYTFVVTLHARTVDPLATALAMTSALERLVPGAELEVESMTDAVAAAVLPAQIGATVTGVFGALALALATFGVYGLVSFSVIQRTREIGIRRAVGATSAHIVSLVVRDHRTIVGVGLALGLAMGAGGAVLLQAFLAGVGPTDAVALVSAVVLVSAAALAASALPALRATRGDPMAALRDG
jgi:ABC-type antimicrobial peptide transport system permease subunit